jgi:glycosyltransferase involved in cell wall biosynthesis
VRAPGPEVENAAPTPESGLPRVGVVSAWFDPEDPRVWSGVPRGLVTELRRLGVYSGHHSATPWPAVARVVYRWAKLTGRDKGWARRAEMRALSRVSDVKLRASTPSGVDGWVHLVGGNGPVVRGRYVSAFEMSPSQLLEATSRWASSLGYPNATRRQLAWVAKRQAVLHRHAYACCMASRWAADSLVRDHGIPARKIHVVGYGRNATPTPPAARDWSSPRFLYVGRDWKRKNGDAVVRAFVRVRREVPDARLDLVGRHPDLDLEGVAGHGMLAVQQPADRALMESLFASATCFVLPSFVEPFGIVYVEAAAGGVPSIAGSIGGTADSVGDGGILVDPYDDDALFEAMRRVCDPDVARALGDAALARSARLTWQAHGQRVLRSLDLAPIPGVTLAEFL